MKNIPVMGSLFLLFFMLQVHAQENWKQLPAQAISKDTITKNGYTLVFINQDAGFDRQVQQKLTDVFFTVYPAEASTYNTNTLKTVVFFVDPQYTGVAATSDGIVRFNPQWFHKHPADVDVVTHEVMHLVQAYPESAGPGWLTEGIADYVRYQLGVNNAGAQWVLPEYNTKQSYENAYRVTARFLVWIEKNKHAGIVKQLDAALRAGKYTPAIWKNLTGQTTDELWNEYSQHPGI